MVADLLCTHGCPQQVTVDRDVRFVSSPQGSDSPSALVRFCHCLGVAVRYHRSYQAECLAVYRPRTLQEVQEVTAQFEQHYNYERPHQGRALWEPSATQRFCHLARPASRA